MQELRSLASNGTLTTTYVTHYNVIAYVAVNLCIYIDFLTCRFRVRVERIRGAFCDDALYKLTLTFTFRIRFRVTVSYFM